MASNELWGERGEEKRKQSPDEAEKRQPLFLAQNNTRAVADVGAGAGVGRGVGRGKLWIAPEDVATESVLSSGRF